MTTPSNMRILVVDDNVAIHEDFRKVLGSNDDTSHLNETEKLLFGAPEHDKESTPAPNFIIETATQGQEALELVQQSQASHQPYAVAFVDIRMPPGWDGIETIKKIWEVDPAIQTVICSAHSDYSWEDIKKALGGSDRLLILKKPFDVLEIQQTTWALVQKWDLNRQVQLHVENLEQLVKERTIDLEKSLSLTKATLESTAEGIIVISNDNKITDYNKTFLDIWELSEENIKHQDSDNIFKRLANQVENAGIFLDILEKLHSHLTINSSDEWILKNGKILELYTHPQVLHDTIIGNVCSFRDISERKRLEQQLLHLATHDALTQLPNRALLLDRIEQAIVQAKRYGSQVVIFFFDLDNFKRINDTLGHHVGDTLLKFVAKRLRNCIRESDTVARLGGDEFVVVANVQDETNSVTLLAQQFLNHLAEPYQLEDNEYMVFSSIGISIYPKDGQEAESLLKNADSALYLAKENRNDFKFYSAELSDHILRKMELEAALRQALEKNQFVLHYQPLVDLQTTKIVGIEALLRWQHPDLGLLLPGDFLTTAEETGLIIPIGEWVLRTACQQNMEWHKNGQSPICIAVNISAYQLRQHDFVDMIKKILQETGLPPQYLELELAESLFLGNQGKVIEKMMQLKALNITLVIDNFGTGYASLNYVKTLPFDKVKIDKNFVHGVNENIDDTAIVESIIGITKSLNLKVLAQGVETEEQVNYLREHLNGQVQGYYFSRPMNEEACTKLLKE